MKWKIVYCIYIYIYLYNKTVGNTSINKLFDIFFSTEKLELLFKMADIATPYTMDMTIPFPTARHAEIAYNTLRVDKEPSRGGCKKTLTLREHELLVHFQAGEARVLRVASNSFLDFLILVSETMEKFGPPVELT